MVKRILIVSLFMEAGVIASTSLPLENSINVTSSQEAIIISGDSMDYDTNANKSTVVGNARAERGSGLQKHILTAKKFNVYFKSKNEKAEISPTAGNDIEKIEAIGDAVLVKEADKLTVKADYCFYRPGEKKESQEKVSNKIEFIECQNNVKLTKAGHYLEGDKAIINIDTGVYKVTSDKRKGVRGIMKPPPKFENAPPVSTSKENP